MAVSERQRTTFRARLRRMPPAEVRAIVASEREATREFFRNDARVYYNMAVAELERRGLPQLAASPRGGRGGATRASTARRDAPGHARRDEWEDMRQRLESQGWVVERTSKSHWRLVPPDKSMPIVITSSTPSDKRALRNARSQLRRSGARL